jgi:hypothetical protein
MTMKQLLVLCLSMCLLSPELFAQTTDSAIEIRLKLIQHMKGGGTIEDLIVSMTAIYIFLDWNQVDIIMGCIYT